jgi:hypothetical protein
MEGEGAGLSNGGSFPALEGQQRQSVLSKTQHSAGFMYLPLADGCIRVLKIDRLDDSDTLCCTLSNITLDNVAEYDAISYAWNNETLSVLIKCNGQHLFVTSSLYEALLSLYVAGDKELLWADAVCTYPDRSRIRHLRNLRFEPLFCEGVDYNQEPDCAPEGGIIRLLQ